MVFIEEADTTLRAIKLSRELRFHKVVLGGDTL